MITIHWTLLVLFGLLTSLATYLVCRCYYIIMASFYRNLIIAEHEAMEKTGYHPLICDKCKYLKKQTEQTNGTK